MKSLARKIHRYDYEITIHDIYKGKLMVLTKSFPVEYTQASF